LEIGCLEIGCLEIGRRGGAHRTVLLTFISSVHYPKVMLGMLIKVLRRNSVATRRRLPRERNVTFKDLMGRAADFDAGTITIEALTSLRHLLPIAAGIITVITAIRSAGLSCSHDTFCINGEVGSLSKVLGTRSQSGAFRRFSLRRQLFRVRQVRWADPHFQQFFVAMPAETRLTAAVSRK
jgi:hypothetical protein